MQVKKAAPTKRLLFASTVLVYAVFVFSSSVLAENKLTELKVGYLEIAPANTSQLETRPTREVVKIVFETLDKAGFSYSYQAFPPTRLYKNMATGETDLSAGMKGQPQYNNSVLYGKKVLLFLEKRIYAVGDRPIPATVDELFGKKIALKRDYGYGGDFERLTTHSNLPFVYPVDSAEQALAMLNSGRVDFILDYKDPITALIETSQLSKVRYKAIERIPLHFIVSKHTPNAQQVLNTMEDHFVPKPPLKN